MSIRKNKLNGAPTGDLMPNFSCSKKPNIMKNQKMYTTNEMVNDLLNSLDGRIKAAIRELKFSHRSLVKHNYIVQVGALTICTKGEKNIVSTENVKTPTQFCVDSVKQIMKIPFYNGHGDPIKPKAYKYTAWYKKELELMHKTRKDLLTQLYR